MNEILLQFIWRYQYFNKWELRTTTGENIGILDPGIWNHDQGPDFLGARIVLDGILWSGNVELHINEGDWDQHGHDNDPNFRNVILHVVWSCSGLKTGLPTLELEPRVPVILLSRYREWMLQRQYIPCSGEIGKVPRAVVSNYLESLLTTRLRAKADELIRKAADLSWNWEELCWHAIARAFGYKVNADPFECMARTVPFRTLLRIRHDPIQVEALLFGQAGLLRGDLADLYAKRLWSEYVYLQNKFKLGKSYAPVHFLRMRPGNFPTIRLAQLATLVVSKPDFFHSILMAKGPHEMRTILCVETSSYWRNHYRFGVDSSFRLKQTGSRFLDTIIINTMIPLILAYATHAGDQGLQQKVIAWSSGMHAEDNSVLSGFRRSGVHATTMAQGQGLLQLHSSYCSQFRCLECAIGRFLLTGPVRSVADGI